MATTPIPASTATTTATAPTTIGTRVTTAPTTIATTTIPLAPSSNVSTGTTLGGPDPPCEVALLLKAADDKFGPLPAGSVATDPHCQHGWASALLTAPSQGNAFAVFQALHGEWDGQNLGTDQVCSDVGVPLDLYGPLGCGPWEG